MSVIDRVSLIVSVKNSSPVRITFNDGSIDCVCVTPIGRADDVCHLRRKRRGTHGRL